MNPITSVECLHGKFQGLRKTLREMPVELLDEFFRFRVRFLEEELQELKDAETAADRVDALADLTIVAVGTLDAFGVDCSRAFWEVHRANMAKSPGIKPGRPNPFGLPDLVKPHGWSPPDHVDNVGEFARLFPGPEIQ